MQIKIKLLLWFLAIQALILVSFNYALSLNIEHHLNEKFYATHQTHEMVEHFLSRMWILTPFILLLSSIGGYVLVTKYFQPIQSMLKEIKTITPKNLSLRIQQRPYNDEINHLAIAFNEMLDRLEKAFRGVKEFNTHASHELRTPLTIMRGEIEIALRKERSEQEYKTILETQLEEIQTLQKLIEDLLFLAEYNALETQQELEGLGEHTKTLLEIRKAFCTQKVAT